MADDNLDERPPSPGSPDRKRSFEDDASSDDESSRGGRFKRQAIHSSESSSQPTPAVRPRTNDSESGAGPSSTNASSNAEGAGDYTAGSSDGGSHNAPGAPRPMALRALITTKEAGVIIGKNGKNVAEMREQSGAKITVSDLVQGAHERVVTVSGPLDQIAKAFSLIATKIVEDQQTHLDIKLRELTIKVLVPHTRMGQVIGKQGSQIKKIQEESGAKVTASEEMLPGSTERSVTIVGVIDSIHIATYHIGVVLSEHPERSVNNLQYKPQPGYLSGSGSGGTQGDRSGSHGGGGRHVGGPAGGGMHQNRHNLQGAGMGRPLINNYGMMPGYPQRPPVPQHGLPIGPGMQPMQPVHPAFYNAAAAGMMAAQPNMGAMMGPRGPPGMVAPSMVGVQMQQIFIPNDMVGAIIGKGGMKINEIRQQSGCQIKIAEQQDGSTERLVTITGTPEANQMALYMLYSRLEAEKARQGAR
ncbi:KH domain-containing protein [Cladochytrium replicatum]|nr:KH domain-containing protein [Cladochytrium replicatum]